MNSKQVKTRVLGAAAIVLLVAMAGCSSMSVTYDYDNNIAWGNYRTYAWLGSDMPSSENMSNPQLGGELLDKRVREAMHHEMEARGIKLSDTPDILVKYHLGTEEKVQVTDWGYRYSDYYWGYGGRQIDVYQFTQGMLVVDIIDAEEKTLVWRGTATGTVEEGQRSPEEMQERVNKVLHKILENFPPH